MSLQVLHWNLGVSNVHSTPSGLLLLIDMDLNIVAAASIYAAGFILSRIYLNFLLDFHRRLWSICLKFCHSVWIGPEGDGENKPL